MFGYVLPEKPELKIKEYELFKAYYCGVCKSIGKRLGQLPRLTLTYDSVFLALVLSGLAGEKPLVGKKGCAVHPMKKRNVVLESRMIDYASDINILLAYYKLEDNWKDEKLFLSAAGKLSLKPVYRKLFKKYAEKCRIIECRLEELRQLEKHRCDSMDRAAEPFAKLMEEVMACELLCGNEDNERILRWIGYNLGKWIYILDAYDDIEDNIKSNAYNPLVCQFDYKGGEDISSFKLRIKERVEFNLTYSLNQIAGACQLIEKGACSGVIDNIVYMGMLRKTEQILGTGRCSRIEKSL